MSYKERNKRIAIFFSVFILMNIIYFAGGFPTFMFPQIDKYRDFATINYAMKDMNPYISWLSNYPPLILAFSVIFVRMNDWNEYDFHNLRDIFSRPEFMKSFMLLIALYALFVFIACVIFGVLENKRNKNIKIKDKVTNVVLVLLIAQMFIVSAPSLFMIDRGNYLVVTVVLMLFWAIYEEMKPNSLSGSVFAALTAATKVYPVYLLGMYFVEKKWKKLLTAICVGAVVTVVPVLFFYGNFFTNIIEFLKAVVGFGGTGGYSVYYTVGVTGYVGVIYILFGAVPHGGVIKLVWLLIGCLFTAVGFFLLSKEEKIWKKLLVITSLMVFLSPNSFLYNSCYLFAPILIMLMNNDKLNKIDIPYFIMTALLMVPKSYFYFPPFPEGTPLYYSDVNIGVFLDCTLYFALIIYYFVTKYIELKNKGLLIKKA